MSDLLESICDSLAREINQEIDRINMPALLWFSENETKLTVTEKENFWKELENFWNRA